MRLLRSTPSLLGLAVAGLFAVQAHAATQVTLYYPVSVGGPLTQVVDGLVADFEQQHPDIRVKPIYAGNYDEARVKALAALKAGQPVQTSVLFSIDLHELKDMGVIRPFDDYAKSDDDKAWLHSFYPALRANGELDGKVWGIPFQRSTIVMYYNKDAFRAAGLDPEQPPKSWQQLREVAAKLTQHDANGQVSRWGLMIPSTGYPYWMFGALAKQNGADLMNTAGNQVNFTAKPVVEALQFWQALGNQDKVMPTGTIDWGTLRQNFVDGKTAMMWHSTGNLTAVLKDAKFDVGVAPLPGNAQPGSPTGGGNFYLFNSGSPAEQQAAFQLVRFLTEPAQSARWSIATGYVATTPAAYQTAALQAYAAQVPQALVARDQLEVATAELATHQAGRVRKLLDDAIQSVLTGKAEPDAALQQAQRQADRLLKPFRS